MAIIFLDGFDAYGSSNGSDVVGMFRKWPTHSVGTSGISVADGRISGKSVNFFSTFTRWIETPMLALGTLTVGFGFRATIAADDIASAHVVSLYESTNLGVNVRFFGGELHVYNGTTLIDSTSGLALPLNTWGYIELAVTVGNSGSYELRWNGQNVSSGSADTQPGSVAQCDTIRLGKLSNSQLLFQADDFYIDDAGTFYNTPKIVTIFPNADSDVDCTPSTGGDNSAMVDDAAPNDDTDYVTGAPADVDLYDCQNLTNVSTVFCVQVNTVCRQTDATPLDVALTVKSGSTQESSTPQVVGSTDYVLRSAIWEENPDTSAPWTASEIDAGQFGFEIS